MSKTTIVKQIIDKILQKIQNSKVIGLGLREVESNSYDLYSIFKIKHNNCIKIKNVYYSLLNQQYTIDNLPVFRLIPISKSEYTTNNCSIKQLSNKNKEGK